MADYYNGWAPYVPVAERRRQAAKEMEKLRRKGHPVAPVVIEGRSIARTFWGQAWCENLEHYSDYANRLPRGRTYVRNGSVVDLQIAPGLVRAQVSGSSIYQVRVQVQAVAGPQWRQLCQDCGGAIESLVELLQGRFSQGVMARICRQGAGLFPAPAEIKLSCSCPDGAYMCKHVAAVLYGIGARLDHEPELLFQLRGVDGRDLLAHAASGLVLAAPAPDPERVLGGDDLAELFGLELGGDAQAPGGEPSGKRRGRPRVGEKPVVAPARQRAAKAKPTAKVVQAASVTPGKARTAKAKAKPKGRPRRGVLG